MNDHSNHGDHHSGEFTDITEYGSFHHSSGHTEAHSLEGGRTPITTEAMLAYNGMRAFFGLDAVEKETVGQWAFDEQLTNNAMAYGDDLSGVGLYYAMQAAKVAWIADDAFDPQILAEVQRTARLGDAEDALAMIEEYGHDGFYEYLVQNGLEEHFINTLKMEPHYGGWMHGRTHGWLNFTDDGGNDIAIAHDLNHLTVLSHDQTEPFMNDTFDWPQWPALDVEHQDVIDYFQSMLVLGDPLGDALPAGSVGALNAENNVWYGTSDEDIAHGSRGDDIMKGQGKADTLKGGAGADALYGGGGDDALRGNNHDDMLRGNGGDDRLYGGRGDDEMSGGTGEDSFFIMVDTGVDTITDFTDDEDTLKLDAALWNGTLTKREVVEEYATESAGDVILAFDGGETVILEGFANKDQLINDINIL